MSVLNQKTIKETIAIDGVGLHSGKNVHMEIKPAKPNTGIVFKRTDIKDNNFVVPGVFNVRKQFIVQLFQMIMELLFQQLNI